MFRFRSTKFSNKFMEVLSRSANLWKYICGMEARGAEGR